MKIYFKNLLFLVAVIFINCNAQRISYYDNQDETFLLWLLNQRSENVISQKPAYVKPEYIISLYEEMKVSFRDSVSIGKQVTKNNADHFKYSNFADKTFLPDSATFRLSQNTTHLYLKISKPIFFDKGRKILIFIEEHCGDLCGSGVFEVYEKTPSGFNFLIVKEIWIS
jgi:hypothetical protein